MTSIRPPFQNAMPTRAQISNNDELAIISMQSSNSTSKFNQNEMIPTPIVSHSQNRPDHQVSSL